MRVPALIAGAMLLAAATDWSSAQQVNVVMQDNRFVPDRITLRHGVAYRLHLENRGKDLHEFTAGAFFADTVVRDPGKLANAGTDVVVSPGRVVDVDVMPIRAGTFRLICADHDWDGMTGEIVVE